MKNLRGELTPAPKNVFSYQEETLLVKLHEALHHTSTESIHTLEKLLLPNVILHMTQKGYINFIKDLQENGIDINQCDFEGRNIFHIAARENNLNIIKHLLENLQTLDAIDKMDCLGRTPLYEALSLKNKQIVYQLKNKGAINFGEKKLIQKLLFK